MKVFLIVILCALSTLATGQCPTAEFEAPSTACINSSIILKNSSTNFSSSKWHFCNTTYTGSVAFSKMVTNYGVIYSARFVEMSSKLYLFFVSQSLNKLVGLHITNVEAMTYELYCEIDLGTIVSGPAGFELIQENETWIALITTITSPYKLIRINLGVDIKMVVGWTDLSATSGLILNVPVVVKIVKDGSDFVCLLSNSGGTTLQQINRLFFGSSLNNTPVVSYIGLPSGSQAANLEIHQGCSDWKAFVTSRNGKVFRIDFGASLSSTTPTVTALTLDLTLNDPTGLALVAEHDMYELIIQSRNGNVYTGELQEIGDNTVIITDHGNVKNTTRDWDVEVVQVDGLYRFITTNFTSGGLAGIYNLDFPLTCPSAVRYSETENVITRYTESGSYKITLEARDETGNISRLTEVITILDALAPGVEMTFPPIYCTGSIMSFSYTADQPILAQGWSFGDNTTSPDLNPMHVYTSGGTYYPSLTITASNSCQNFVQDTVQIFNPPQASFDLPQTTFNCTNQTYVYNNASTYDDGSIPTWQWNVNGSVVSTESNLTESFVTTGSQTIRLTASIPGCSTEEVQTFVVSEVGLLVDFSIEGKCQTEIVQFTNETVGSATAFAWDFGDTNTSSVEDAQNIYNAIGSYQVTLVASNLSGCNNSMVKDLIIYSQPQPTFQLELPPFSCNGMPSQFTDATPNPTDSNITSWQWNFDDGGSSDNVSSLKNPTHTYANAGQYNVTLTAGTNYGCENSIIQSVTVSQTPSFEILNTPACDDVPVTFSTSAQSDIKSWNWQIGITQFTLPEPIYTFTTPGNYSVNLNAVGSNNCIATESKNVIVPQSLMPDFSVQKNCVGQSTEFTDATLLYDDPIMNYAWGFGDISTGTGSPVIHSYQATGNYNINLSITTLSGCNYSKPKSIVVGNSPVASFTASPEVGVPPFEVTFANTSTDAVNYLWNFNDENNSTSTAVSPQFTFQEYGDYIVDLTAFNSQFCSHTISKIITGALPLIDVGLEDLIISESTNGLLTGQVVIHNKGNITIQNLNLLVNLSGITIKETVSVPIPPYSSLLYTLDFNIVKGEKLDYICIEAIVPADNNPGDNVLCASIDNRVVVMEPYPNPTLGDVHLDWISSDDQPVIISVYDPLGKMIFDNQVAANKGFNSALLNTDNMKQGIYFLIFQSGQTKQILRFVVNR